jgi:hypothetical protein
MGNEIHFTTPSTPLAAWLKSQGFTIIKVTTLDFPAIITFEDSQALHESIRLWQTGQAEGNVRDFFDAYREILGLVKPSRIWKITTQKNAHNADTNQ